jgi:hypothetical protein
LVNWFPDLTPGVYTHRYQAAWTVTGSAGYLLMGGEFLAVNGTPQQGLVRFAVKPIGPGLQGPRVSGADFAPTLSATAPDSVQVSWTSNWDRDDKTLQYRVIRDGDMSVPAYSVTADSEFWNRPVLSWTDTGLVAGSTHTYQISANDSSGNTVFGKTLSITTPLTSS